MARVKRAGVCPSLAPDYVVKLRTAAKEWNKDGKCGPYETSGDSSARLLKGTISLGSCKEDLAASETMILLMTLNRLGHLLGRRCGRDDTGDSHVGSGTGICGIMVGLGF